MTLQLNSRIIGIFVLILTLENSLETGTRVYDRKWATQNSFRSASKSTLVPNTKLNWREAHSYCRSAGGFLPAEDDLKNFNELSFSKIWTALTYVENRYQWLSRKSEFGGHSIQWEDDKDPEPWETSCPLFNVDDKTFSPKECHKSKNFFCILEKNKEQETSNVELRVTSNIPDTSGWIEVSQREFQELELKCLAVDVSSNEDRTAFIDFNWQKDGIWLPHHNSTIKPAEITPISRFRSNSFPEVSQQGTYCCETWVQFSAATKKSNCILVTLKNITTLILTVVDKTSSLSKLDKKLSSYFSSPEISAWINEMPVDLISVKKSFNYTYKYYLHILGVKIRTIREILNQTSFLISNKSTVRNGSSVAFGTYCLEETRTFQYGNEMFFPFARAGSSYNSPYKCVNSNNRQIFHKCLWNFTDGAKISLFTEDVTCSMCPKGFATIGNRICVKLIEYVTWKEGFSQFYQTGNEKTLFDNVIYLDPNYGIKNVSYHRLLLEYLQNKKVFKVWLLLKRKYNYTPYIDHSINYSYNATSLANAKRASDEMQWALHHPEAVKKCAILDITAFPRPLYSENCKQVNHFLVFFDLFQFENNTFLTYHDSLLCPSGWFRVILSLNEQVCIKVFNHKNVTSKLEAEDVCSSVGAEMANPGSGFMDWIFRSLLQENEAAWVNLGTGKLDFQNWLPDTNFSKKYGIISKNGWTLVDEQPYSTHAVICEKNITEYSILTLSLKRNPNLNEISNNSLCLEEKPVGHLTNFSLVCLKNGAELKPKCKKVKECLCLVNVDEKGNYECSTWSNFPLRLVWSPVFFYENENVLSYVVIGTEVGLKYNPFYYDSTFYNAFHRKKFEPSCMNMLFRLLNNVPEGTYNNFTNVHFLANESKFQYLFHLQCREPYISICVSEDKLRENLNQLIGSDPKASKLCEITEVRSTIGCRKEQIYSMDHLLTWPDTDFAGIFLPKEYCFLNDGQPTSRKCKGSFITGYYWLQAPDYGCPLQPSNKSKNLWRIREATMDNLYGTFSAIVRLTYDTKAIIAADFVNVAQTMRSFAKTGGSANANLDEVVSTMNNLMGTNESVLFQVHENFNSTFSVLENFETLAFRAAENTAENFLSSSERRLSVSVLNISIGSSVNGFEWVSSYEKPLLQGDKVNMSNIDAAILFPTNLSKKVLKRKSEMFYLNNSQVLFALHKNPNLFLDNEMEASGYQINTKVIQTTFQDVPVDYYLLKGGIIKLFFRPKYRDDAMVCVFWDFQKNDYKGGWSNKGCRLTNSETAVVTCECDHLSSFAVLIKSVTINPTHESALNVITIIGCSFSIFGLVFVLLTFIIFEKFRKSLDNKILTNLSLAIFLSLVIFLGGIKQTQNETICEIVAVSLYYFILVSFGWMLAEAVHNYQKFVKVYGGYIPRFIWIASATAWGLPLIPIIAVFSFNGGMHDYGREPDNEICWISTALFQYTFVPYVTIVLIINAITYIMIINSAIFSRVRLNSNQNQRQLVIRQISMAICIFFLLGLTWIFGFLSLSEEVIFFSYLFCISNTLQGFIIFFFHIYRNRNIRKLWTNPTDWTKLRHQLRLLLRIPSKKPVILPQSELEGVTNPQTVSTE